MLRTEKHLFQRVGSNLAALIENEDATRKIQRVVARMGDHDKRSFVSFQKGSEQISHFTALFIVQTGERFVH